jgi:hypothetical protein
VTPWPGLFRTWGTSMMKNSATVYNIMVGIVGKGKKKMHKGIRTKGHKNIRHKAESEEKEKVKRQKDKNC